jgi:HEPN domain-containing protein
LIKAQRDLISAKVLASDPQSLLDTAVYHCQQAAEKSIKAWLVFHDQRTEKTHDLRLLVSLASTFEPGFGNWLETAERLTPYATEYRYPGEFLSPEKNEFDEAFQQAEGLYLYVLSLLPVEFRP